MQKRYFVWSYIELELHCFADSLSNLLIFFKSHLSSLEGMSQDFPSGPVIENLPAIARDRGSVPGPGRFHMPLGN